MLGSGDKDISGEAAKVPLLLHVLQSAAAFALAQKIWQNNQRYLVLDAPNRKECLHFLFSDPACTVWLQREQGRSDVFELILLWDDTQEKVTEVYVITASGLLPARDDSRAKELLAGILASPATVPVSNGT